jgi:hypothetical protein
MQRMSVTEYISREEYFKLSFEERSVFRQSLALVQLAADEHFRYLMQRAIARRVSQAAGLGIPCKSSPSTSTTMPA